MAQLNGQQMPVNAAAREKIDEIHDRPAILFAGQGSQCAGMGRDIAESDADSMELWKQAERVSGLPLREIFWEGEEKEMSDTRALQPALSVFNFNLWRAWSRKKGIVPAACAGHSLGEYSALAAACVISPESMIELTSLRGKLMADADPEAKGAMAAIVRLNEDDVEDLVKESAQESGEMIVAANYNTPEQIVISGAKGAVELACQKAKHRGGRSVILKVSGAFHSPMMENANRELAPLIEKTEWKDAVFPVYCNADGQAARRGAAVKNNILKQMTSPVQWVNIARNLYITGIRWWMEISPRAVLGKMIGPSLAGIAGQCDTFRIELLNSLKNLI